MLEFCRTKLLSLLVGCMAILGLCLLSRADDQLPPVDQLPRNSGLPNPLQMRDGKPVTTVEQWREQRRPELKKLFQHYMYGYFPAAPQVTASVDFTEPNAFDGAGTLKCLTLRYGPTDTPPLHVLVAIPNKRTAPAPVFVGLNFLGNHSVVADKRVPLATSFMPPWCKTCVNNKATEASRGIEIDVWSIEQTLKRGYAVVTAHCGDIDPDVPDFTNGVHPHFRLPGQPEGAGSTKRGPHDWATIAAWAWGVHRIVDYVVTDKDLDKTRIAVFGHSRLGKTALLAGAFDERITLVIPHQAGCGGTAPSRHKIGESVERINKAFPHWFCDEFKKFGKDVDRLPFDQHCLVALCAPRPVLFSNAVLDTWADPTGQFRVLQAASPVYKFLGVEGLKQADFPAEGKLVDSKLGYYIRAGQHSTTPGDWKVFCDFADKQFTRSGN